MNLSTLLRPRCRNEVYSTPELTLTRNSDISGTNNSGYRLNRFLARAGIASRRRCDELIKQGRVSVNGETVLSPGFRVKDTDIVFHNGAPIDIPLPVTAVLNKPPGYETTLTEASKRNITCFMTELPRGTVTVGRLDVNTCGLLILSNDGELIYRLSHPSREIEREYLVELVLPVPGNVLKNLRRGADIGGGYYSKPDSVLQVKESVFRIILHTGRNREVRKLLKAFGLKLKLLTRIRFSSVHLGNLTEGTVRILKGAELAELYDSVDLKQNFDT